MESMQNLLLLRVEHLGRELTKLFENKHEGFFFQAKNFEKPFQILGFFLFKLGDE